MGEYLVDPNLFVINSQTSDLQPQVLNNNHGGFAQPPDVYGKEVGHEGDIDKIVSHPQIW